MKIRLAASGSRLVTVPNLSTRSDARSIREASAGSLSLSLATGMAVYRAVGHTVVGC